MKLHPTGAVVDIHAACREAIQNFRIIMQADILLPQCKSTPDSGGRRHWCSCTSAQVTLEFYQPHQRHLFGPGTGTELILPTVRISNLFTLKSFSEASIPLIVAHLHLPPVACIVKKGLEDAPSSPLPPGRTHDPNQRIAAKLCSYYLRCFFSLPRVTL
jgi:hypothetical protein